MFQDQIVESISSGIKLQEQILDTLVSPIETVTQLIASTLKEGSKVLLLGNGGSAASAQHFAAELVGRFRKERVPLPAIALSTDTSILTAIANDYSYSQVFSRQIEALGKSNDLVIGFSTSGNSANIIEGMRAAKEKGLHTVGFTGQTGGQLSEYCDWIVNVPSPNTARIQEMHTLIGHVICEAIDQEFPDISEADQHDEILKLSRSTEAKFRQAKLLILDFDGVLTDNRVLVHQDGTEAVFCHRGDGWGIARLKELGLEILVLSTETNSVVKTRCQKLRIDCIHGCSDKLTALKRIAMSRNLELSEIAYVGNDVNDLACMQQVGLPIGVSDAVPEIKAIASMITQQKGGYGAVREVADHFLRLQSAQGPLKPIDASVVSRIEA